jgi:anti-sigma-K factor RskA
VQREGGHVDGAAELYALGALEPRQRRRVDAHAEHCAVCARALRAACETVAALDELVVPLVDPPPELGARIAASAKSRRGGPDEPPLKP